MRVSRNIGKIYTWVMLAAIVFGAIYAMTEQMDFIRRMIGYNRVSITNVASVFFRFECILLPLVFVLPRNSYLPKIVLLKFALGVFCVTCLAGVMWFFKYLNYENWHDALDPAKIYAFQENNLIAVNRFLWGNQSIMGVVFSLILSIMYAIVGIILHKHRTAVAAGFSLIALFRILMPFVTMTVYGAEEWQITYFAWFQSGHADAGCNVFWMISQIFFVIGIWIVASSDDAWISYIWGEPDNSVVQLEEEEDF